MLSRLKLFCQKCPFDSTEYDFYKFQEHHASFHQGGFHLYACPRCKSRFVTSYLAAHHMLGCWKDSSIEEYAVRLDTYNFTEYQVLKDALDKATADALKAKDVLRSCQNTATFASDSNDGLCTSPLPHSDRQNNNPSYSVESVFPDDRNNFDKPWGDRGLLGPPHPYRPSLLGDGPCYDHRSAHLCQQPSPFPPMNPPHRSPSREKRRSPRRGRSRSRTPRSSRKGSSRAVSRRPRSRDRERSPRNSDRDRDRRAPERRSSRDHERGERRENWRRDPPNRRTSPRAPYERPQSTFPRPDRHPPRRSPSPSRLVKPNFYNNINQQQLPPFNSYDYQGSFQPRLIYQEEVHPRAPIIPLYGKNGGYPRPRRENIGRGVTKLTGPMSTNGLVLFSQPTDQTNVMLEIRSVSGPVTMHFDSKILIEASPFFRRLLDSPEFQASDKKLEIHRSLIPFLDVMNLLHFNKVPWKVHCKPSYFTIFHLHRIYRALKEAKELGITKVTDFLAKDLFLSRCNLLNDTCDCTSCIERIAVAKHFELPVPEIIKFTEMACVQWIRDCEERSCAPELNVTQPVINYLRQFIVNMTLPGISN